MATRKQILREARLGVPAPTPGTAAPVEALSVAASYRNWYESQKSVVGFVRSAANAWAARKAWRP